MLSAASSLAQMSNCRVRRRCTCRFNMRIFFVRLCLVSVRCCCREAMQNLTPEQKHSILTHYTSRRESDSAERILSLHGVKVTTRTFFRWLRQWDGTVASLTRAAGSGRPRLLSSGQVKRHVATRIRSSNRSGVPVRYTKLLPQVEAATGQRMSVRTLRRYGKQELHAAQTRGKKRTADEGTLSLTHSCRKRCWLCDSIISRALLVLAGCFQFPQTHASRSPRFDARLNGWASNTSSSSMKHTRGKGMWRTTLSLCQASHHSSALHPHPRTHSDST